MRILIVDDDDALRTWLVRQLEPLGHDVMEAAAGDEALCQFNQHNFDFVLTDYMFLPGCKIKNGAQLLGRIKKLNRLQPMALMTSAPREAEREFDGSLGRLPILKKLFTIEQLLRLLPSPRYH